MKPFLQEDEFDVGPFFATYASIHVEPGELICDIDVAKQYVFLVRKGLIRNSLLSAEGGERLMFFAHGGWLIGDTIAFGPKNVVPHGVRAVAVTPCEVARMPQAEFRQLCSENADLVLALLRRAYGKVSCLIDQLDYATFRDTTVQVAALLHALWVETKGTTRSSDSGDLFKVTHETIAAATGRTRVSVTYALKRLRTIGAVELYRGRIEVRDAAFLARLSQDEESGANLINLAKAREDSRRRRHG